MMKKIYYYTLAAACALLSSACAVDDYDFAQSGNEGTVIRLTAGTAVANGKLNRAGTSIQSTHFDADERLNVYIWSGDGTRATDWIGAPTLCKTETASGEVNELTPVVEPAHFPKATIEDPTPSVSLYGLYPESVTRNSTTFTVKDNQKIDDNYKLSDLMWGGNTYDAATGTGTPYSGVTATSTPIGLNFHHKMAKFIVKVTTVDGVGTVNGVQLKNVCRTIGFSPANATLDAAGLTDLSNIWVSNDGSESACLLPPQTIRGEFLEVTFENSEDKAVIALAEGKELKSNSTYMLDIIIGPQNLTQVSTIDEWPADKDVLHVNALGKGTLQIDDIEKQSFTGSPITPTVHVTYDGATVDAAYYDLHWYNNTEAGYAVVVAEGKGTDAVTSVDYNNKSAAKTFYIEATPNSWVRLPEANMKSFDPSVPLAYNGTAQPLLRVYDDNEDGDTDDFPDGDKAGKPQAGMAKYCLSKTGYFTTAIPTAVEAGTYSVWAKVDATTSYGGLEPVEVQVTITKGTPTITPPSPRVGLVYNEKNQLLLEAGEVPTGCTMYYSLNGTDWSSDIPRGRNAGSYTVYYKVEGSSNYSATEPQTVTIPIAKAPGRVATSMDELKFGRAYRLNSTKVITIDRDGTGEITYELSDGSGVELSLDGVKLTAKRLTEKVVPVESGKTLKIKVAADNNYEAAETPLLPVSLLECTITLGEIKATDAKYEGFLVSSTTYIYPNSREGMQMLEQDGGRYSGVITYIGSDAKNGHGYVLANDRCGSQKWGDSPNPIQKAAQWNSRYPMDEDPITHATYSWYLGSKEDYNKAVIARDVINKEWLQWTYNGYSTVDGYYWNWPNYTSTEAGSKVWVISPYYYHDNSGRKPYCYLKKEAKSASLFGADITVQCNIIPMFSF